LEPSDVQVTGWNWNQLEPKNIAISQHRVTIDLWTDMLHINTIE
jgi:hypothetical protein